MNDPDGRNDAPTRTIDVPLHRDLFLRTLLGELSSTLQDVVGLEEASGYVSVVGQRVGAWINAAYESELGQQWSREQVAEVLVDLKRRIDGDFSIETCDAEQIVLTNRRCPFGDKVRGRPSMCMMTSNVFGHITAEHLGFARVSLVETIAEGQPGCRVLVQLRRDGTPPGERARDYFRQGSRS